MKMLILISLLCLTIGCSGRGPCFGPMLKPVDNSLLDPNQIVTPFQVARTLLIVSFRS